MAEGLIVGVDEADGESQRGGVDGGLSRDDWWIEIGVVGGEVVGAREGEVEGACKGEVEGERRPSCRTALHRCIGGG